MKTCKNCKTVCENEHKFCSNCGSSDFIEDNNEGKIYTQGREQFISTESNEKERQIPEQYNPVYSSVANNVAPKEEVNALFVVLSIFFPIVGVVLYFVDKNTHPKTAKICGIIGFSIFGLAILSGIAAFLFTIVLSGEMLNTLVTV